MPISRRYDPDLMRQMSADGKTVADIADHYGVSRKMICAALRHHRLRPQDQPGYQPSQKREQALTLARAGFAARPISIILNCSESTVRWWIAASGVTRKPDIHMPTVKNSPDLVRRRLEKAMVAQWG
jgi:uncharacterized protein YjcR